MTTTRALALAWLALLLAERGAELVLSARNARRLLSRGGREVGRGHYPVMVAFHAAFLGACALEAWWAPPAPPALAAAGLAGAAAAQGLRWWAIAALRGRWTTRVIVLPGAAPVTGGPYRWLRHPNYLAVAVEVACVPLALGAFATAALFTMGNAVLLAVRIRAEERALGGAWARAFAGRPRLFPGVRP